MTVKTISRRPRLGDYVAHVRSGNLYLVTSVYRTPGVRGVHFYAVDSVTSPGHPNTFEPSEVRTLGVLDAHVTADLYWSNRENPK